MDNRGEKMKIYIVNGKERVGKTEFSTLLADRLTQDGKVLLVAVNRSKNNSIEDYYDQDGMISYDLCDYFLEYIDLDGVINKKDDKLSFIISPFVKDKYQIKKEDLENLISKVSYDYLIFDGLELDLDSPFERIQIIEKEDLEKNLDSDYYFLNKMEADFDQRLFKEELLNKKAKYLGFVNLNGSFNRVIENLVNKKEAQIENIGFFEKIMMKFKK